MRKILLNTTTELLNTYTKITGVPFRLLNDPDITDAVAVVIAGQEFKENLEAALILEVPTLVVAGRVEGSNKDLAIELGYPLGAIIIKEGDCIKNMTGKEFAKDKGIKAQTLVEMCNYAFENKLCPSVYVWVDEGPTDTYLWEEKKKPCEQPHPTQTQRTSSAQTSVNSRSHRIVSKNLIDLFNGQQVVTVFKTVSDAQSSEAARILAKKTGSLHLEITGDALSFSGYGADLNKAILSGRYSYSKDGNCAEISSAYNGTKLLVEVDLAHLKPELIDVLYEKSSQIIHVPGSFDDSSEALKMWVDSGYKLDRIIAITDERRYRSVYGDLVKTLEQLNEGGQTGENSSFRQ